MVECLTIKGKYRKVKVEISVKESPERDEVRGVVEIAHLIPGDGDRVSEDKKKKSCTVVKLRYK